MLDLERDGDVSRRRRSRTCCASSRRRCSARSCAATATSTTCEDAVQEALLAAAPQWPARGGAGQPDGLADHGRVAPADRACGAARRRAGGARRRPRALEPPTRTRCPAAQDDTLTLLLLCCHPALTPVVAGGADAARGRRPDHRRDRPRVPGAGGDRGAADQPGEAAHQGDRRRSSRCRRPRSSRERLAAVLHVLYLIFNEGYTASSGAVAAPGRADRRGDPADPRSCTRGCPDDGEVAGLLALMLLTDARRPARTAPGRRAGPAGRAGPLAAGTRPRSPRASRWSPTRWHSAPIGPYQLQAAIAAVHDEATRAEDTDWPQILGLYELLERAGARPDGHAQPDRRAGDGARPDGRRCAQLDAAADPALAGHHRVARRPRAPARAGRRPRSGRAPSTPLAARRTLSLPEQRYLESRASALG